MKELSDNVVWKTQSLTKEAITSLEDEWRNLAHDAIEKNVYLFPWFIEASLSLFDAKQPEVVLIYHQGLLIGLFLTEKDLGYAKIPIGFFRNALHPHQFLGTPLVRKHFADQFTIGLFRWLDASPLSKSFLLLSQLSGDKEITTAIHKISKTQGRQLLEIDRFQRAMITLPTHGTNPEGHLSASRKKSLKRKRKALSQLGELSIEQLTSKDKLESWFEDFARLENLGWKQQKKTSIQENLADVEFYRQMLPSAADDAALNFFRLTVNGKPIAYTLDLTCPPFVYCHRCAYDLSYKKYAPGVLMEYETLKIYNRMDFTAIVDSCTSPDNQMINELWPNRKSIVTLAIAKKGIFFQTQFAIMQSVKKLLLHDGKIAD